MDNTCSVYLHTKIKTCSKDFFDDLGFMDEEDIRSKLLLNKFDKDETSAAVSFCAKKGVLDLYYFYKCRDCDEQEFVKEEEYPELPTYEKIKQEGAVCDNCGYINDIDDIELVRKYCISHKILSE